MADTVYEPVSTNATTTVTGDDGIQHGIDDNPNDDAKKGAQLGGVGGAVTGAIAGAAAGPLGLVAGAIIGGVAGAVASGAAVAAVDSVDNDNTISGIGGGSTADVNDTTYVSDTVTDTTYTTTPTETYGTTGTAAYDTTPGAMGNGVPGVQTGGYANDGTPDTRGMMEKTADAITGDTTDDKTGETVYHDTARQAADSGLGTGFSKETDLGETTTSLKTGGVANDGTPDTRGIGEKVVDAVTGDTVDDKTGKVVNHS